jgi:hypothetical protein
VIINLVALFGVPHVSSRIVAGINAAAAALLAFLVTLVASLQLSHVRDVYLRRARGRPDEVVRTAGGTIDEAVGRDELCRVLMGELRNRRTRRPLLIVGGQGSGKTALLVRLARLLAEQGLVPVPVALRDARGSLDFRQLARDRFVAEADAALLSGADVDKVWRELSQDDKIVVLADGLEDALGESPPEGRDSLIRLAIHRAREAGVPLIIASLPHDPLRFADATILELEPLSEEAALEYIGLGGNSDGRRRLNWIVETADLTELPLCLQITRQLFLTGRLDQLAADGAARKAVRHSLDWDRSRLRLHLLDTWMEALFDGRLMQDVPLNRAEREAAVEWLSALACIGLEWDTIDVKFEDYYRTDEIVGKSLSSPKYGRIDSEIQRVLRQKLPRRHIDIRLAVAWGAQLGLVEEHGDGLRFRHGIMQAYLGSRFMRTALEDDEFRRELEILLRNPGRDFLIALVLYSRQAGVADAESARRELETAAAPWSPPDAAAERGGSVPPPPSRRRRGGSRSTGADAPAAAAPTATATPALVTSILHGGVESIRDALTQAAAETPNDVKQLDLYAAALEIDSFLDRSRHSKIARRVADGWADLRGGNPRTLDEAKLGLVHRFGDAARAIAGRQPDSVYPDPAYRELLGIGLRERSYPVRLAIAQEIGAGGDEAVRVLHLSAGQPPLDAWAGTAWPAKSAKQARKLAKDAGRRVRGEADRVDQLANEDKNRVLRGRTLCAWLAPLLAGSADKYREEARLELARWLDRVGRYEDDFPVSLEVALAQGFKLAANRRRGHPRVLPETSLYLAEQAMEMLKRARFWFSQLTLIHALCLWEMPEPTEQRDDGAAAGSSGEGSARDRAGRHGSNPEAIVRRWLQAAGNKEHPFVAEAGYLAVQALQTGQPERFLSIDEGGIASRVGSRSAQDASYRVPRSPWIPPSAGWAALDPRAQQLVADVLLALNLTAYGSEPDEIEQFFRIVDRSDLPPCLTGDRDPLDPRRTVGALRVAPGSKCVDGCLFRLCPYPPRGALPYYAELNAAFCHELQAQLARHPFQRGAAWQTARNYRIEKFWGQMGQRAQIK